MSSVAMYCRKCGEAFESYKPKVVLCHLPEGEPGEVIELCPECEGKIIADYVKRGDTPGEGMAKQEAYDVLKDVNCKLARIYQLAERFQDDPSQWLLVVDLTPEQVKRVKELGINVSPSHDNKPQYVVMFFDPAYQGKAWSRDIPADYYFKADVTFAAWPKDDNPSAFRAVVDDVRVRTILHSTIPPWMVSGAVEEGHHD